MKLNAWNHCFKKKHAQKLNMENIAAKDLQCHEKCSLVN